MLDYKLLEAHAMVIREGGFDRAARALHLTQSAVSQRVRQLEDQVGRPLISRTNPPRPTADGRRLLAHFNRVAGLETDLMDSLGDWSGREWTGLGVAVNGDSLATWFLPAVEPFLSRERALLDIRIDDQDQTHHLLRENEVTACVASRSRPMQGCRMDRLGRMVYRLCATPDYAARWFPGGLTRAGVRAAPMLIFNRKDELHRKLLTGALGRSPGQLNAHYLPSAEKFPEFIAAGLACGMLPDQDAEPLISGSGDPSGGLVDLAPEASVPVDLFWHRSNVASRLLDGLSEAVIEGARAALAQPEGTP